MAERVRLVDIAERLGITKVTVSKGLRDHPDISEATRRLVKETAAEMGYSPNLLARSLSAQKTYTLGVVVPKIAHTFFSSVIDAIQDEATAQGYGILLAVSNERADLERQHIDRLLAMRVDGLLVSVSKERPVEEVYEQVRSMRIPLVFFDRKIDGMPFSSVTVDDREGAYRAVSHLIEHGYRNIAHVAGSSDTAIGRERMAGYRDALAKHGIEVDEAWVVEGGFDELHGYEAGKRLLDRGALPEVIFAVTFPVSLGIYAALREVDPKLPDEVELIAFGAGGFDELYLTSHFCVRQPTQQMGKQAVLLLLDEIETLEREEEPEVRHVTLQTSLITPRDVVKDSYEPASTA